MVLIFCKGAILKKNRKRHEPHFKYKVALEAIKGVKTLAEISSEYGVHPTLICAWKKHALISMEDSFTTRTTTDQKKVDNQIDELHKKAGELTVELDYLKKIVGRFPFL
jgi:transposase-like protein